MHKVSHEAHSVDQRHECSLWLRSCVTRRVSADDSQHGFCQKML